MLPSWSAQPARRGCHQPESGATSSASGRSSRQRASAPSTRCSAAASGSRMGGASATTPAIRSGNRCAAASPEQRALAVADPEDPPLAGDPLDGVERRRHVERQVVVEGPVAVDAGRPPPRAAVPAQVEGVAVEPRAGQRRRQRPALHAEVERLAVHGDAVDQQHRRGRAAGLAGGAAPWRAATRRRPAPRRGRPPRPARAASSARRGCGP